MHHHQPAILFRVSRARHTRPRPPSPRTDTISYDPTRVPGPRDISYPGSAARIVMDLMERFCEPDADQSAPWNTVVCTAGVPPITSRMLSQPPAYPSLSGPIFDGLVAHAVS